MSLGSNSILGTNTKHFCHKFNVNWIFWECNDHVIKGRLHTILFITWPSVIHHLVKPFTDGKASPLSEGPEHHSSTSSGESLPPHTVWQVLANFVPAPSVVLPNAHILRYILLYFINPHSFFFIITINELCWFLKQFVYIASYIKYEFHLKIVRQVKTYL